MTPRRLALLLPALGALLLVGACGVAEDGGPQEISAEDIPESVLDTELSTTTTRPDSTATESVPFYLSTESEEGPGLAVVERELRLDHTPVDVITELLQLDPTEEEAEDGLTTAIPADTALNGADLDPETDVLTLDVTESLLDPTEGQLQITAFAQIVYTATELDDVEAVRFEIDGDSRGILVGDSSSTTEPVDRGDYPDFRPNS